MLEGIQSFPELAQALLAHGRFEGGGDNPAGGRTLIERALHLFEEMGATEWIDEAQAALQLHNRVTDEWGCQEV